MSRSQGSETGRNTSLDYTGENPTPGKGGFSGPEPDDSDPDESDDEQNWSRQQNRVFQRSVTMLKYWEARNYDVLWLTLTTCPESKPAEELAYSSQRLRQRIERADLAMCDGKHCPHHDEPTGHRLSHIDSLEHLQIRTCEGPQGVVHAFLAWDRDRFRDGNHDRDLFIPQSWLSEQWAAIHGSEVPLEPDELHEWPQSAAGHMERLSRDRAPFVVDVRRVGPEHTEAEHKPEHMAAYAASQYLGDHGEALEHLGWSHGRSLGGPLAKTWQHLVKIADSLDDAIDKWDRVIAGSEVRVELGERDRGCHSITVFKPPPSLGVELVETSVTPPPDYEPDPSGVRVEDFSSDEPVDEEPLSACAGCGMYRPRSLVVTVRHVDGQPVRICDECRDSDEPGSDSELSDRDRRRVEKLIRAEGIESVPTILGRLDVDPSKREAVAEVVDRACLG